MSRNQLNFQSVRFDQCLRYAKLNNFECARPMFSNRCSESGSITLSSGGAMLHPPCPCGTNSLAHVSQLTIVAMAFTAKHQSIDGPHTFRSNLVPRTEYISVLQWQLLVWPKVVGSLSVELFPSRRFWRCPLRSSMWQRRTRVDRYCIVPCMDRESSSEPT